MRMKRWVPALGVVTLLGALSVPAVAQEKPKLEFGFHGLIDAVTTWTENMLDSDLTTDETEWYSRQRARLNFSGAVGKSKVVWGTELDIANGFSENNSFAGSCGFRLDTDIGADSCKSSRAHSVETKHLYLEFMLTGPGSLLPFIEVPTTARAGGQPFQGHDYKYGMHASGDFGGLRLATAVTPAVQNVFSFVQIDEQGTGVGADIVNRDSYAVINSVTFSPQKGLTVRPTISFGDYDGGARLTTPTRDGFAVGERNLWRVTFGGDVRWRQGPYSLDPTFFYQFGQQDLLPGDTTAGVTSVDINAWIFDVIGGWRSGPLKLEGRFQYSPGNDANECVQTIVGVCTGGSDINSYNAGVNNGFVGGAFGGWAPIFTTGGLDYLRRLKPGSTDRGTDTGFDKYGLWVIAAKATYSLTPAFSVFGLLTGNWTAEDVDTNGSTASSIVTADGQGDENFLGTEFSVGLTWRFAPNVAFGWQYAHLFAGDALDQCPTAGCVSPTDAEDVDYLTARVRYTF